MSVRMGSLLSGLLTLVSVSVASAQPGGSSGTAPTPAPAPPADPATTAQPVEMTEDPAPADMDGTTEDPDAPKVVGEPTPIAPPPKAARSGYPIEEALRPITLPQNMSEVTIDPHLRLEPFETTMALRARYGITRQVQLGLTYVLGSIYDDPATPSDKTGFHPGKAVGLDVTILLQDWIAVRVGVPVYIDPVATSLMLGVPLRFIFPDARFAIGGLDDLLNIRLTEFAPEFYSEQRNAQSAANVDTNTTASRGWLRFSGYAQYNHKENLAFIGRFGVTFDDFSSNRGTTGFGGVTTSMRVGVQLSPKPFLDLGFSLGFDDMARAKSFGPGAFLAFRI